MIPKSWQISKSLVSCVFKQMENAIFLFFKFSMMQLKIVVVVLFFGLVFVAGAPPGGSDDEADLPGYVTDL